MKRVACVGFLVLTHTPPTLVPCPNTSDLTPTLCMMIVRVTTAAILILSASVVTAAKDVINYADHIRPVFQQSCFNCHNPDKAKGGLDLTSYRATMAGSSTGEVVVSLDAGNSRLLGVMSHTLSPKMPPRGEKVADAKIELIRKWIEQGVRETSSSAAAKPKTPRVDLSVGEAAIGRPDGPAIMPVDLPLGPVHHTSRPGAINAVASHPWSPIAAVTGQKQTLLFNTQTGELLGVLPFEPGQPETLRFSWTGRLLLVGGGIGGQSGIVVIYDVLSGEQVAKVGEEVDSVLAADIDPTQRVVALGGPGKRVKGYSVATGELIYKLDDHTEWITAIAFSPDGDYLATGDRNGGLRIWEADTGEPVFNLEGHQASVTALSWRYDGKLLASSGEDEQAKLWEMSDGKRVKAWKAHSGGVRSIAYAEDGRLVTTGRDQHIKVWDGDGKLLKQIKPFDALGMTAVFDTQGKVVVSGDLQGKLVRWSLQGDAKEVDEWPSNPLPIKQAAVASAGKVSAFAEALKQAQAAYTNQADAMKQAEQSLSEADKQLSALRQRVKVNGKVPQADQARKDALKRRDTANRDLNDARNKHRQAEKNLRSKVGESKRSHQNHGRAAADLEKKTAELTRQTQQVEAAQKREAQLKTQAQQSKASAEQAKAKANHAKAQADQAKRQADQARKQSDASPADAGLKERATELARKAAERAKQAEDLKKKAAALSKQSDDQHKRLQAQTRKLQDLKRKADQLRAQQKAKSEELGKRVSERNAAEDKLEAAKKDEAVKRRVMDGAQQMADERSKEVEIAFQVYDQARKDLDAARRSVQPAEQKLKSAIDEKQKIEKALAQAHQQAEAAQVKLAQAQREQIKWRAAEVRLALDALCQQRDAAMGATYIAKAKRDKLNAEQQSLAKQFNRYQAQLADAPQAKKRQEQAVKQAIAMNGRSAAELLDVTNRLESSQAALDALIKKRDALGRVLQQLKSGEQNDDTNTEVADQIERVQKKIEKAQSEVASLKLKQEDATYDAEDAEHAVKEARAKLAAYAESIAALPGEIKQATQQRAELVTKIKAAEVAVLAAGKPAAVIQRQIDALFEKYRAIREGAGLGVMPKLYQ